jgi:hypothetical protein
VATNPHQLLLQKNSLMLIEYFLDVLQEKNTETSKDIKRIANVFVNFHIFLFIKNLPNR